jgi:hypothetical protein
LPLRSTTWRLSESPTSDNPFVAQAPLYDKEGLQRCLPF